MFRMMGKRKKHIKEKLLKKEILEIHGSYHLCDFIFHLFSADY
jgi:hypothetical protein